MAYYTIKVRRIKRLCPKQNTS